MANFSQRLSFCFGLATVLALANASPRAHADSFQDTPDFGSEAHVLGRYRVAGIQVAGATLSEPKDSMFMDDCTERALRHGNEPLPPNKNCGREIWAVRKGDELALVSMTTDGVESFLFKSYVKPQPCESKISLEAAKSLFDSPICRAYSTQKSHGSAAVAFVASTSGQVNEDPDAKTHAEQLSFLMKPLVFPIGTGSHFHVHTSRKEILIEERASAFLLLKMNSVLRYRLKRLSTPFAMRFANVPASGRNAEAAETPAPTQTRTTDSNSTSPSL